MNTFITNANNMDYYDPFMKAKLEKCQTESKYMVQTQTRILIKSIIYRIIAFMLTTIISFYFTKNYTKALQLGIIVETLNTIIYYIYEQLWNVIDWGYSSKTTLL